VLLKYYRADLICLVPVKPPFMQGWLPQVRLSTLASEAQPGNGGGSPGEIYKAKSKREAVKKFRSWKEGWGSVVPKAVKCIERDLDRLLSFYPFSEKHRKKIRTTNAIERWQKDLCEWLLHAHREL